MLRACDVMQTEVVSVGPWDPLQKVEQLFSDEEIHGAPVIDESGQLVGVISASDLLGDRNSAEVSGVDRARSDRRLPPPEVVHECVSDVMSLNVIRVHPDDPIREVARTMRERQVHRVIVMENDSVLGLISTMDMLQVLESRV